MKTVFKFDLAKRKRVMQRSMKLGHCICDPKSACPCQTFKTQDICPCAGESPKKIADQQVKLTQIVHHAGCASKIPAADLERFLSRLPLVDDSAVISGLSAGDDAGVYRINNNTTLVQTVDLLTPCVDDPLMFGKICATNCLSDIYAMGGIPRTALSVLAFPSETFDGEIMYLMLKGAMQVLKEANCALLGGHSLKDDEIKLGFSVTGTIDADRIVSLETVEVGDVLVLTKPLGVGVLNFARQIGRLHQNGLKAAELSMMTLNRAASEAMVNVGVSACTDITGFGLFGHLMRMLKRSKSTAKIDADLLPAFEGVIDFLKAGVIPGAIERNAEFVADDLIVAEDVSEEKTHLGLDAQTSGGLLISVPIKRHPALIRELKARGITPVTIGEITSNSEGCIQLVTSKVKSSKTKKIAAQEVLPQEKTDHRATCCCG